MHWKFQNLSSNTSACLDSCAMHALIPRKKIDGVLQALMIPYQCTHKPRFLSKNLLGEIDSVYWCLMMFKSFLIHSKLHKPSQLYRSQIFYTDKKMAMIK